MLPIRNPRIFDFVFWGCGLFVALTLIAMFFYPGGTMTNDYTTGYSFFENFFSELGFYRSHTGGPNTVSFGLFVSALTLAGTGLAVFFLGFPRFFQSTLAGRALSALGSLLGILSALCFIGVAFTPADINRPLHVDFVLWAFRLFPGAVLCYTIAMFRENYAKQYALFFVGFFGLLVAYILLLEFGPEIETYQGMVIQAAGQKVIVYASIISIMIQSAGARQVLKQRKG